LAVLGSVLLPVLASAVAATPAAAQETRVLIVAGLGGTADFRSRFLGWSETLRDALVQQHGVAPDHVTVLAETPDSSAVVQARSTRANVLDALARMASESAPQDRVVVVLIGHGTSRGEEPRFNLPGPDLTPEDFDGALVAFPTQELALVHTGSASGGFLAPLSGPNRVIITATRTIREQNATEFPRFFVEALEGDGADLDKDGRVSLLEAFQYASQETARWYDEDNRLLTEHAVLDDDGDGEGSRDPGGDAPDGRLAAAFHFESGRSGAAVTGTPAEAADDPELAELYQERTAIQQKIDDLRAAKDTMAPDAYDEELEALLVDLALKNREIRAREDGGG
jgi:hypothetical protein